MLSLRTYCLAFPCLLLFSAWSVAEDKPAYDLAKARSFLAKYCTECHGQELQENELSLHQMRAFAEGKQQQVWSKVVEALRFGKMPPDDALQPTKAESRQLTDWIEQGLRASGHESDINHKLQQPAFANLLSHRKLFDGSVKGPAYSVPRLWRLHPQAYDNFLTAFGRQLNLGGPLSKPFTVGDGKGLASNYAALTQADSATLSQLMLNCKQVAQYQTEGFKRLEKDRRTKEMVERLHRKSPPAFLQIMENDGPVTAEQIAAAVAEEFKLVLGRTPNSEEARAYQGLLKRSIAIGGKVRGLKTMATAVLLRPEAIYRMEVGLGDNDEHGRRMLSPYELAYAISFALTDMPPQQLLLGDAKPRDRNKRPQPPSLLDIAESGKLNTREDVRRVVLRIWEHEGIKKPRILRFFQEFFGYHTATTVFKGDRANRSFATRFFVTDADRLVEHIVNNDRDVLKELLTTDRYFVQWPGSQQDYEKRIKYITDRVKNKKDRNYKYFVERVGKGLRPIPQANPTWRTTVRFYNFDERTWNYPLEQPFAMPDGQRAGLLTHPAWLVAWSGNFGNDPIRRGKWIREHLLAGSIPDVPITVDAKVPEDPHKTLRQRLQVTRQSYCWQCHQKMEPLGLPFEAYTDFGRHRTAEGLGHTSALSKPKQSAAVVTSGQIINSGDPELDGPVKDVHELVHRLAGSTKVRQSFVRHAFRYWLGRNETMIDSPTLISADQAYVEGGGSFKSLVVNLLTSDSFLFRKQATD